MREVVRVSWLKPIIAGLFVLGINTFMYYSGKSDGYRRGYKAGYDRGYLFGYWRGERECKAGDRWDGHTPDQAIERIATLGNETCSITDNGPWGYPYVCSACGASFDADVNGGDFNYCPNCRARVVDWRWTHDSEVR